MKIGSAGVEQDATVVASLFGVLVFLSGNGDRQDIIVFIVNQGAMIIHIWLLSMRVEVSDVRV